jgi:hypothetical protein
MNEPTEGFMPFPVVVGEPACCPGGRQAQLEHGDLCLLRVSEELALARAFDDQAALTQCLGDLLEALGGQAWAAAAAYRRALELEPTSSSLLRLLGTAVLSLEPEDRDRNAPILEVTSPTAGQVYGPDDPVPVRVSIANASRPPPVRVCAHIDALHLPTCHVSYDMLNLTPGPHVLHIQAFSLTSHRPVQPPLSIPFCVGSAEACSRYP